VGVSRPGDNLPAGRGSDELAEAERETEVVGDCFHAVGVDIDDVGVGRDHVVGPLGRLAAT